MNDQSRAKYESRKRKEAYNNDSRQWRADFETKLKSAALERHEQAISPDLPTEENETEQA